MEDSEKVKVEIDRRKLQKLVDDGVVSAEDIANAPIVFVCECGQEQDAHNESCIKCGEKL